MTDRFAGFIVTLEEDIREDDAEVVVTALRQIRGVLAVEPVVAHPAVHIAESRVRHDAAMRLFDLAREFGGAK